MKNVLLVDDNKVFVDLLSYSLKKKHLNILCAYSVDEAIEKISKFKFDLICSDFEMGTKNGLELLEYLRRLRNDVQFIMLTGNDSNDLINKVERMNGIFMDKTTPNLVNEIIKEIKEKVINE